MSRRIDIAREYVQSNDSVSLGFNLPYRRYNKDFKDLLGAGMNQMANVYPVRPSPSHCKCQYLTQSYRLCVVLQGSFLEYDWSDGDVVFANSTCFDDQLMAEMGDVSVPPSPILHDDIYILSQSISIVS